MTRKGLSEQIEFEPVVNVTLAYDVAEFENIDHLTENMISDMQQHPGPALQY